MLASWYDDQGPAADVLHVGELPDPTPGPGEVRVRVTVSGVNPGDTKKRRGWLGSSMPFPRVIPHSDAAGVIDAVGDGRRRPPRRTAGLGVRRPVLPRPSAPPPSTPSYPTTRPYPLPDHLSDELGASLGIPGITAHRTVFADGPVDGQTRPGPRRPRRRRLPGRPARPLGRRDGDRHRPPHRGPRPRRPGRRRPRRGPGPGDPAAAIRAYAPAGRATGSSRSSLSDNADLDNAVAANGAVIAAYATRADRTEFPFWPLLFNNVTLRLLGSDDFPAEAKRQAARDLTAAAAVGALTVDVGDRYPLEDIAKAHDRVDAGGGHGRVLVTIPQ